MVNLALDIYPQIRILFSNPIWTVLDYLLQNPEIESTDIEISRNIKQAKKSAVNIALRKLAAADLTKRKHRGRMVFNKLCDSPLITQLKIASNIIHIQPYVKKIARNCIKIILFGSRAYGIHTSESDFDLFIVTTDLNRIFTNTNMIDKVQLIQKTSDQMLTLNKDEPVLYNEIKKGIVLWEKI